MLRGYEFLEVLDSCHIDSLFDLSVPLLILSNVIASQVKVFDLVLVVNLHHDLHDPAKVVLVLGFSYAEALEGV